MSMLHSDRRQSCDAFQAIILEETCLSCNKLLYYIAGSSLGSSNLDAEKEADSGQLQHRFFHHAVNKEYTIMDAVHHGKIV